MRASSAARSHHPDIYGSGLALLFVFCFVPLGLKCGKPGAGIIARSAKIK